MTSPKELTPEREQHIEVDLEETFDDSCSSVQTDTTSVNSSVFNYEYENGRRYHHYKSGKYVMPNDEQEQDRLDVMHHIWLLLFGGKLHIAPLASPPRRVLDIGTGTGLWAIELGDTYPDATVTGTDLSPIQPGWVPPNVKFEVDDLEEPWTFGANHFDFIHTRNLIGSIKDWSELAKKAFDALTPGGYLELQESDLSDFYSDDGSLKPDSVGKVYVQKLVEASNKLGRRMDVFPELPSILEKAGFVDVTVDKRKVAIGGWPKDKHQKELGIWVQEAAKTGAEAYALALFTRVLGMEATEAKKIIEGFVEASGNRKIHMYGYYGIVYARKPEKC